MKFEWDKTKNKSNKIKHGLQFETAALVFQDPYILSVHDERYLEERWYSVVGLIHDMIIYVAHIIKEDKNDEDAPEIKKWDSAVTGEFYRPIKKQVTLRLDADVLDWFKNSADKTYFNKCCPSCGDNLKNTAIDPKVKALKIK